MDEATESTIAQKWVQSSEEVLAKFVKITNECPQTPSPYVRV